MPDNCHDDDNCDDDGDDADYDDDDYDGDDDCYDDDNDGHTCRPASPRGRQVETLRQ